MLKRAEQLCLELIRQPNRRFGARLRISMLPLGVMLIACAATTRVIPLDILACSHSSLRDEICIFALSRCGSDVGDVAGACEQVLDEAAG